MLKRWVIFSFYVQCKSRATRYNKKLYSIGRKILGLCFGARKRQFCKTYRPFLCYKSTRLCSTAWLTIQPVCPHCKHLDTFEFLCVVQVKRTIALHNRKLKSKGINLIQLAPSCRKEVAYRFGRIFIDQNKNILTAKSELAYTVYRRGLRLV